MTQEVCSKWVPHGGRAVTGQTCGRPVKEEGLCGIHLAAKRRREKGRVEREVRRAADEGRRALAEDACKRLAALGIKATPSYSWSSAEHTGGVTIASPADVARLLDDLEGGK